MKDSRSPMKMVVLALSAVLMSQVIPSPILADIATQYPTASSQTVQLTLTLTALFCTLCGFIAGPLSKKIEQKRFILFALLLMIGAGLLSFFAGKQSLFLLLLGSAALGGGLGVINTMTPILISKYFHGRQRSAILGMQCAMVNGGGILIVFFSGLLAGIGWNYAYLIVLLFLPVVLLTCKYLPDSNKEPAVAAKLAAADAACGKLPALALYPPLVLLLMGAALHVYSTNVSLYLRDFALGTATTGGMLNTLYLVAGGTIGVCYGSLFRKVGINLIPFAAILGAAAFYLASAFPGLLTIAIAGIAAGFCQSAATPTCYYLVSIITSGARQNMLIAVTAAAGGVGMFVSTLLINPLSLLLGDGGQQARFLSAALLMLGIAAVLLLLNRSAGKRFVAMAEKTTA